MKTYAYEPKDIKEFELFFKLMYSLGYRILVCGETYEKAILSYKQYYPKFNCFYLSEGINYFSFDLASKIPYQRLDTLGAFIEWVINHDKKVEVEAPKNIEGKDVKVGQYITIHSRNGGDKSWYGDVLLVEAVNFPYVIAKNESDRHLSNSLVLDTREVRFMQLTPDYVKAALPK